MGGGTDLAGQVDRGIRTPTLLVDLRESGLAEIAEEDGGLRIGASVTLAGLAAEARLEPYEAVRAAASLAASPLLRNVGTVGGNLAQHTRCWYYRGEEWHCWLGGGDTCYAQIGDHRKHNLEPGDCISAHPSDLAPALAACGATVELRSRDGAREVPLLELYRHPTEDDRSLLALAPGELVTAVRLPGPPDASAYERVGERAAFSFPLVSVAAARRGDEVRVVASGVANVPRELDPAGSARGPAGQPADRLEAHAARDACRAGRRSRRLRARREGASGPRVGQCPPRRTTGTQ